MSTLASNFVTAREFILAARAPSSQRSNPIFERLPWLSARNLGEFLPYLSLGRAAPETQYRRRALQEACRQFHIRAGTLTDAVQARIDSMEGGEIVRLAHQPNLFCYAKLIGQFFALDLLAQNIPNAVPLYYFIDYDIVSNSRFRQCELPNPLASRGIQHIGFQFKQRTAIATCATIPTDDWFATCTKSLAECATVYDRLNLSDARAGDRLERLLDDLRIARERANNVADMNAILISRYVNLWLSLPISFVPGSALWSQVASQAMEKVAADLTELYSAANAARKLLISCGVLIKELPDEDRLPLAWWHICSCGSRAAAFKVGESTAEASCPHCGIAKVFSIFQASKQETVNSVPRILLHNVLNVPVFGYRSGVSHIGSAEHILVYSLALQSLGRPVLPQWLWECVGPFDTRLERSKDSPSHASVELATNGNAAFAYFALCQSPDLVANSIRPKVLGPEDSNS